MIVLSFSGGPLDLLSFSSGLSKPSISSYTLSPLGATPLNIFAVG